MSKCHAHLHIATNSGHTAQNDGRTMQNDGRTTRNVGCMTLNVSQLVNVSLRSPPGPQGTPPTPILEKTCLEMIFRTLGTKKIERQYAKQK